MKATQVKDKEFVRRFIDGDRSALESLISRHKDKVYNYIYFIVKDEEVADDIFQDTFIKVIHSLKKRRYNEQGAFVSWVIRIAHNLTIDYFRKGSRIPVYSNDANPDIDVFNDKSLSESTIEEDWVHDQILRDVRSLVDMLPNEQREVVLLRHFGNMNFKEIAEQTNVSINTALGRMRYALINLRKLIAENNVDLSLL
ncbi:MAG: RNA polymerase subunit sigma-24 [Bacteroidia bacterium]|nr:MAG: RNA polymerase subunit sigma-24 [Bacteroidia bacterium]